MKYRIKQKENDYYYSEYGINLLLFTLWFKIRKFNLTNKYDMVIKYFIISTIPLFFIWLLFPFSPGLIIFSYIILGTLSLGLLIKSIMDIDYDDSFNVKLEFSIETAKNIINSHKKKRKEKTISNKVVAEMKDDGSYLEGKDLLRLKKFKNIIS